MHRFGSVDWQTLAWRSLVWVRRRNLTTVLTLLLVAAGCWGFIELADEVLEGETRAFDHFVLQSLRNPEAPHTPIGPPWFRESVRDVTALGSAVVLLLVTLAVAGFCLIARNWTAMGAVLVAALGGLLMSQFLKHALYRERPTVVPHLVDVATPSFPSGHSMMSAAVYLTLGVVLARFVARRPLKSYFIVVATTLTVLVGLSRIYLGVHYPTDVLAGWTAGAVWALLCGTFVYQMPATTSTDEVGASCDSRLPLNGGNRGQRTRR